MVTAVIPVKGRLPLLKHTINRLTKNGIDVICIGDKEEKNFCEHLGAQYIIFHNFPLGQKWNEGFRRAKEHKPEAVLFVGSSDWVTDNWVDTMLPHLDEYGFVGKAGCHFLDYQGQHKRLVHWPGYAKGGASKDDHVKRADEPIGGGRLISARLLDKINWQPFESKRDSSLDWAMYQKTLEVGEKVKIIDADCHVMSISTNQWPNKHIFEEHWHDKLKSEKIFDYKPFLQEWFPEALEL